MTSSHERKISQEHQPSVGQGLTRRNFLNPFAGLRSSVQGGLNTKVIGSMSLDRRDLLVAGLGVSALATKPGRRAAGFILGESQAASAAVTQEATTSTTINIPEEPGTQLTPDQDPDNTNLSADYGKDEIRITRWDWIGTGIFAKGIRELLPKSKWIPGGRGHIGMTEYAALGTTLAAKYANSDEVGREHIVTELKSGLKAFVIIAGTSAGAQGISLDIEKAFEIMEGEASIYNRVAVMNMAASVISPVISTVGTAAAHSKEAQSIARYVWEKKNNREASTDKDIDHKTVGIMVDHLANCSGFVGFGDPPWIAMMEKFGLKEALRYQAEVMWPLAMYSLISGTIKLNREIIEAEGELQGSAALKKATQVSYASIRENLPFLGKILGSSFVNLSRYISGGSALYERANAKEGAEKYMTRRLGRILSVFEQSQRGYEFHVAGSATDKVKNLSEMVVNSYAFKFPLHGEALSGITTDHMPELEEDERFVAASIEGLIEGDPQLIHAEVEQFLEHEDYEGLQTYLAEHHGESASIMVTALRRRAHEKADEFIASSRSGLSKVIESAPGVGGVYGNINLHRTHNALGAQLTDVVDVFPFQATSVEFLLPFFRKGYQAAQRKLNSQDSGLVQRLTFDAATYAAFAGFSSIADNYIAVKIGLDIDPGRPELYLSAGINGGRNLVISNMANCTLVPLNIYSLADSARQMKNGADLHLVGYVYPELVNYVFRPMGYFTPPEPKAKTGEH